MLKNQIGYFLKYYHWENAIDLLNYQISLKLKNRHFNRLSIFHYEKLSDSVKQLREKKYFKDRILNNLFYGLEKEFTILPYPIPKSHLGLRTYTFFTYPMRVLYYAVGLYLVELTQELIKEYKHYHKNIQSNYGGNILFGAKTKELKLSYDTVWYKEHYRRFRRNVRREIQNETDHKIIIHIDIQNYFEEISIPTLLKLLYEYVKPSTIKHLQFDAITQQQLLYFFNFIAKGKSGIPQSDNNIISSFIGYLYLIFGDLFIEQELYKNTKHVKEYNILRYMDDTYISITFQGNAIESDKEEFINSLASRISDCLYERLGLRLNTKTKLFRMNEEDDRKELERNLKKVSPGHEINDEDEDNPEHPNQKVENIFKQLEKLKRESLDPSFKQRYSVDEEILKEIFDERVNGIFNKKEHKNRLKRLFNNFNFNLVNAEPLSITILILKEPQAASRYHEFLLSKPFLTSRDIDLILTYLAQTEFSSIELLDFLKNNNRMNPIINIFKQSALPLGRPGYYDLNETQILKLSTMPNAIEQIRLRISCEQRQEYSVALNHLLSEIHAICWHLDPNSKTMDENRYEAPRAIEFLVSRNVPYENYRKIANLFDRRNKNPVSHPDPIAWVVTNEEYLSYRFHVGECLRHIL